MNRCSPATAARHIRLCNEVLAHGYTPELRTAAEMHCLGRELSATRSLFDPQHAYTGVASRGQPDPAGCVHALPRKPE